MSQPIIRVIDGRHVVGLTENGKDWRPIGRSFETPREAIAFSDRYEVPTPSGGVDSPQPSPLGVRADLPGADPGTHPPGV